MSKEKTEARCPFHHAAGGDHLGQSREVGGAELELASAGTFADREGLIAEAMTVVEQQHPLASQIGRRHGYFL